MKTDILLDAIHIDKHFGQLHALQSVSLQLKAGQVHALLGENGAGKSTLVKCIMGYYKPDGGQILFEGREETIVNPQDATALGIGMVYQHFTLINNMTVAENIVLSRPHLPPTIDWATEIKALTKSIKTMPFQIPLEKMVATLSSGEKQKLEIIKLLLMQTKVLILDEPTSVLTPVEADEVLSKIKQLAAEKNLAVLLITHKFREVINFCDEATVLRKGSWVSTRIVAETDTETLASDMLDTTVTSNSLSRVQSKNTAGEKYQIQDLFVKDEHGLFSVKGINLSINAGEIVGVAGVSGNGQAALLGALSGQVPIDSGSIRVDGDTFKPERKSIAKHRVFCLPEEPLHNACVPQMSVALNLALRQYDQATLSKGNIWLNFKAIQENAKKLIQRFNIKTAGPEEPIGNLSGGNVQRTILARELSQSVNVLIVANPCFGLDFKAVNDIRQQIMQARNNGAAVLLISEDLDEILELSDRFFVMFKGELLSETTPQSVDLVKVAQVMAGHREISSQEEIAAA